MTVMMPRALKRWICRLLIGVFASAQLAIAAHAGSGMPGLALLAHGPASESMVMKDGGVDPMLSNVCTGHCQYGHPSANAPAMPPAPLTSLYVLPPLHVSAEPTRSLLGPARPLPAPDPPHAILHCCLRD